MASFKYIANLEKLIGNKFKKCKFNIDGWVYDNIGRYQVNDKDEIIKIKIAGINLKEIPKEIFEIETLQELSLEENNIISCKI